jgi:hypothetical protein
MATQPTTIRVTRTPAATAPARDPSRLLLWGAPVAAVLAGMAAEWLDFRALRYPLLLMVGLGVLATAHALTAGRAGWRPFVTAVLLGASTWGAAETLYVLLHVAQGERFDAPRFGAQATQALGLIGVHAAFLGLPTGVVAGAILQARARFLR